LQLESKEERLQAVQEGLEEKSMVAFLTDESERRAGSKDRELECEGDMAL
jgi:hypothetical protein